MQLYQLTTQTTNQSTNRIWYSDRNVVPHVGVVQRIRCRTLWFHSIGIRRREGGAALYGHISVNPKTAYLWSAPKPNTHRPNRREFLIRVFNQLCGRMSRTCVKCYVDVYVGVLHLVEQPKSAMRMKMPARVLLHRVHQTRAQRRGGTTGDPLRSTFRKLKLQYPLMVADLRTIMVRTYKRPLLCEPHSSPFQYFHFHLNTYYYETPKMSSLSLLWQICNTIWDSRAAHRFSTQSRRIWTYNTMKPSNRYSLCYPNVCERPAGHKYIYCDARQA